MRKKGEETLVTGADGMIGNYLGFGIKTDLKSLDVCDATAVRRAVLRYKPKVIIHLAAETDMGKCEQEPAKCYQINSVGTYNIVMAAREVKAKMVYVSTDAVFNGTKKYPHNEEDIPHPANFYGHSKYLGELAVMGISRDYILIRTSWVFGGGPQKDKKFVGKIMKQLLKPNTKEIKAANDFKSSPTYAKDLAARIKKLIVEDKKGIFHITNSGIATRHKMAKEILNILGLKPKLSAVKSDFFNPNISHINTGGLISKSTQLRPWQEALEEYLKTEWKII